MSRAAGNIVVIVVFVLLALGFASATGGGGDIWLTAFPENDVELLDARAMFDLSVALASWVAALGLTVAAVLRVIGRWQQPWHVSLREFRTRQR